ncbi:MAG: hypothetical protein J6T29_03190 [Alphaproteobacteria bacterium]|nr:hypothetical protein [Alphaproteobacteria bacterium]
MCEEKYKFFNKLLNVLDKIFEVAVVPFLRMLRRFWQKRKYEKNKIEEMRQFIRELALDPAKLKQLDDIMNMPNFGGPLRKKSDDPDKVFFIRSLGSLPEIERWICEQWDFIHKTYYIAIHPLFFKAYQQYKRGS